ncbi:neurogenic protein big brain-like [Anopheles darlingi]|uniref:neurogenic protein big brain-like n=1 Tax=Anopheles darlingi TaxID=43151 RepID=UPI0021005114|nr:neurogenic protein big brain-like [Anopheles darlingi]
MNQSTVSEESHCRLMDRNIDFHIVQLVERLEALRKDAGPKMSHSAVHGRANMHKELRTLELWRCVMSECLASFFYVFVVCGAAAGAGVGASVSSLLLATSLASGMIVVVLTQCFLHVSGAHINPAVTMALAVTRKISPLRAFLYITAQCGGSIAGAAMLYGVTVPGYQGNLQAAVSHSAQLAPWERFGVEFILTFIVVLAYLISTNSFRKYFGSSAIAIGAAYSACSFVSMPYLNPARSLGPSFVLNKWDNHWVYWIGPFFGGIIAGLIHQFVFTPKPKTKTGAGGVAGSKNNSEVNNCAIDMSKMGAQATVGKFQNFRHHSGTLPSRFCHSMYATSDQPTIKIEPLEPIYGAAKTMFGKSPQMSRSNLNRSQSVYAKSNTALNQEIPATVAATATLRPGQLVPTQSLYPLRVTHQQQQQQQQQQLPQQQPHVHTQNQNVQNQLHQRSESIYGMRNTLRQQQQLAEHLSQQLAPRPSHPEMQGFQPIYAVRNTPSCSTDALRDVHEQAGSCDKVLNTVIRTETRPESLYAATRRIHSTHSDDSSYGSYHGTAGPSNTPPTRENYGGVLYSAPGNTRTMTQHSHGHTRSVVVHDPNMPPPPPPLMSCS